MTEFHSTDKRHPPCATLVAADLDSPASGDVGLRISEIHYHPAPPTAEEIAAGFDELTTSNFLNC
jgi:hypothetical protein